MLQVIPSAPVEAEVQQQQQPMDTTTPQNVAVDALVNIDALVDPVANIDVNEVSRFCCCIIRSLS